MLRVSEDGGRRRGGYVEIYRQLGRTLLDLQDAADRIFDVISLRTSQEQDKLSEISRRIQVAKAKIDSLSRSEQALTVISPAQYPSTCTIEENFSPLFQYNNEGNEPGFPVAKLLVDGGLSREYGRECTLELFQFFSEENIGYPLMESDLKKIFEATSFLSMDKSSSTSESESKREELPPPPPSLLLKNFSEMKDGENGTQMLELLKVSMKARWNHQDIAQQWSHPLSLCTV